MNITKENIVGHKLGLSLGGVNCIIPHTPYTKDGKERVVDFVEFEINHKGIEKLESVIQREEEYIMCFVHFRTETEYLDGIYMSVWDEQDNMVRAIDTNILQENEKNILVEYALSEMKEYR